MTYTHQIFVLSKANKVVVSAEEHCLAIFRVTVSEDVYRVRLFGNGPSIDFFTISYVENGDIESPWVNKIANHVLVCLRVGYSAHSDIFRAGSDHITFRSKTDDETPVFKFELENRNVGERAPDFVEPIVETFSSTFDTNMAPIVALLAEARTPALPTHYKLLSLYRAFEILVPSQSEKNKILDEYEEQFAALNISNKRFRNALPILRVQCAHGRPVGGGEAFSGILFDEIGQLQFLVELMRKIIYTLSERNTGFEVFDIVKKVDDQMRANEERLM